MSGCNQVMRYAIAPKQLICVEKIHNVNVEKIDIVETFIYVKPSYSYPFLLIRRKRSKKALMPVYKCFQVQTMVRAIMHKH